MLSVLIPIYNWQVNKLLTNLHELCLEAEIDFEIICIDDNSLIFSKENELSAAAQGVLYLKLPENIGRAKIRNLLAEKAQFENLLFLDCDIEVEESLIENYLPFLGTNKVVYGGVKYQLDKPDVQKMLRWKYGKKHEHKSVKTRSRKPYRSFKSCNFLIPKPTFQSVKFNEHFTSYGHEDTLFGIELERKKADIKHVKNEIIHMGLDTSEEYLNKTKQAINNLVRHKVHYQNVKLIRFANKLKQLKLEKIYLKKYLDNKSKILKNLHSSKPKLINLARFKIGYLLELEHA